MAENIQTFKKKWDINSSTNYKEALDDIYTAINKVKKNITYYDVYNIVETVVSHENFAAQRNALTPNSSLIINTDPFTEGDVDYSRGDVVLKNANGDYINIKAQTGGVYYPCQITKMDNSEVYNLTYSYAPNTPTLSETSVDAGLVASAAKTITFNNLANHADGAIYGLWVSANTSFSGCFTADSSIPVTPVVQFYFVEKGTEEDGLPIEEVITDYTYTYSRFQDDDGYNATCSIVIPSELSSVVYMKVK